MAGWFPHAPITGMVASLIALTVGQTVFAWPATDEDKNPMFGVTHLLPSPFTLPAGRLTYGTDVAFGVSDSFQLGTSLLRDLYRIYNFNAKLALYEDSDFAFALTAGYEYYKYRDLSPSNPLGSSSSWLPGGVMAIGILPRVALFVGGNAELTKKTGPDLGSSGYYTGARAEADLSWAYRKGEDRKRPPRAAMAAGVSYDFTYNMPGFGLSHHWPGFQLGAHYYPDAKTNKVLPIIAGGGTMQF